MKKVPSVFLAFVLLFLGSTAWAADTWLPEFNPDVHVYVSPGIYPPPNFNSDFAKLVEEKAKVNNLNVYIIYTEQGEELANGDRDQWATKLVRNRLWDNWRQSAGFAAKEDRALVILQVRAIVGEAGSIAARAGDGLHGYGLDENSFASSRGPLLPPARQYMRVDQQQAFLAILDSMNKEIANPGIGFSWPFGWSGWVWLLIIIFLVFLLIGLLMGGGGGGRGGRGGSGGSGGYVSSCGSNCGSSCGGGGGD